MRIATVLDAYFAGIKRINEHYASVKNESGKKIINRRYPYQTTLGEGPNPIVEFRYNHKLSGKLVFFAVASGEKPLPLCVKFTRQYSEGAHKYMADLGLAPRLWGVQDIPGGWKMVVMDRSDYTQLTEMVPNAVTRMAIKASVLAAVHKLHEGGYVHGDILDVNILVNSASSIHIVDFDWAGRIDEAMYPLQVNTLTLKRPKDVTGGVRILKRHDIEMIEELFLTI